MHHKAFFFQTLTFFFHGLFASNFIEGQYFWQKKKQVSPLMSGIVNAVLLFQQMLRLKQHVLVASATGLERYDFSYYRFGSYVFSEYADLREYTTKIAVLHRRPALNVFGASRHLSGMFVNSSALYGTLIRHLNKLDNVAASVRVPRKAGAIDFCLSGLQFTTDVDYASEKDAFLIEIFKVAAEYESSALSAAQHMGFYSQQESTILKGNKDSPQREYDVVA